MRIRLKRKPRFSLEKLLLFVSILCISSFALLEYVSISVPLFTLVKWPLLYLGGVCLTSQINLLIRTFMKKKYFYIWLTLLILCGCLLLSGVSNRNTVSNINVMRSTARTICFLIELFALMIWVSEKGYGKFLVNFLFRYVLLLVIATDALMFTKLIVFYDGSHKAYLVGTKFIVSYLHMELMTLWFLKSGIDMNIKNISRILLIAASAYLVIISIRVQCMTGVLGCMGLFICLMLIDRPSRKGLRILNSPVMLLLSLAFCLIFPFVSELIVSIPAVKYFVVEVLGRNENLTGRVEIFQLFGKKMEGHALFGFGMGNANLAAKTLFGYANAQNAFLQWILQAGFLTTAAMVLLIVVVFAQHSRTRQFKKTMPLVILIYIYILLGTVETTFSMNFILWIGLLFALTNEKIPESPLRIE
ncbi:MAG: hypothetical protein IJY91_02620 [Oscillospiraceae bacterium]|nr:hypothetical protein [Oscillospiraceae bacterium]